MTIRVAITGFGRIGRNVLRAHYEYAKKHDLEIVAINAPGDLAIHSHLLKSSFSYPDYIISNQKEKSKENPRRRQIICAAGVGWILCDFTG